MCDEQINNNSNENKSLLPLNASWMQNMNRDIHESWYSCVCVCVYVIYTVQSVISERFLAS